MTFQSRKVKAVTVKFCMWRMFQKRFCVIVCTCLFGSDVMCIRAFIPGGSTEKKKGLFMASIQQKL